MDIKNFKVCLIKNSISDNPLFLESISCYKVEAYRAAYILSYIALLDYVRTEILSYSGVPKNFNRNMKEVDRLEKWDSIIEKLNDEENWEAAINTLIKQNPEKNIFLLNDSIRVEFEQKRKIRNASAHNKNRPINSSTVEDLWDFISYSINYMVINGSVEVMKKKFNSLIKYSEEDEQDEEFESLIYIYNKWDMSSKKEFINFLEVLIIEQMNSGNFFGELDSIEKFMEKFLKNISKNDYIWINNYFIKVYLFLSTSSFDEKIFNISELREYTYNNIERILVLLFLYSNYDQMNRFLEIIYNEKNIEDWSRLLNVVARQSYENPFNSTIYLLLNETGKINDYLGYVENNLLIKIESIKHDKSIMLTDREFFEYVGYIKIILHAIRILNISDSKYNDLVRFASGIISDQYSDYINKEIYEKIKLNFTRDAALNEWLINRYKN